MDSTKSPTGSVRRHRPRRSTRGPLDAVDDPLAEVPQNLVSELVQSPEEPPVSSPELPTVEPPAPSIDLSFLQDRTNYVHVPTEDIPAAFLESQNQPAVGTPLSKLLSQGLYRRAAETALDDLLQCQPNDSKRIIQLLYTRLACLLLISRPDLAAKEAAVLADFLAHGSPEAEQVIPQIPWELRLLLVRLQSIAATDGGRRAVMSLYALAAEVRQHIKVSRDEGRQDALALWSDRLSDLGLRVVDTLVEMGELETATRHLDTLTNVPEDELAYRKALLRLRVGDIAGAQRSIEKIHDSVLRSCLSTLTNAADGNFAKVVEQWRSHSDGDQPYELFASNLAVGLLYSGRVAEARSTLEDIARQSPPFSALLFNLGTIYELCTENAIERKKTLAQNMANKPAAPDTGGWERTNFEFKL